MNYKFVLVTIFVTFYVRINAAKGPRQLVNSGRSQSTRLSVNLPLYEDNIELKPGKPVPRSQQIHRLLTKYLFNRPDVIDGSSVVNFLRGGNPVLDKRLANITVLDPNTIKKMVKLAKVKDKKATEMDPSSLNVHTYAKELLLITGKELTGKDLDTKEVKENLKKTITRSRRMGEYIEILYWYNDRNYKEYLRVLMLQSIYQTRFNLLRTKVFRHRYRINHSFQIAVLYGSVVETLKKMRELHTTCNRFHKYIPNHPRAQFYRNKFLWYLIVYEKMLAMHTDMTFYVKEIFVIHKYFEAHMMHFLLTDPEMQKQQSTTPGG